MSTEAFIYDAIRTPRGKGKKDGSLHEVKPVNLLAGVLAELQQRNGFDTAAVDDVVMGVVSPVGEQGSVIAKVAALKAGWDFRASGVQVNRFCASGLEAVNLAAQKVRSGWEDLVVAGGVESMSRVPIGADGGAWAQDPETNSATLFVPQGIGADLIATLEGFSRADVDAFALESQQRAAKARAAGYFANSVVPVKDFLGQTILGEDEFIKPHTTLEGLARSSPPSTSWAPWALTPWRCSAIPRSSASGTCTMPAIRRASSTARPPCWWAREAAGKTHGLKPRARIVAAALSGADPTIMLTGPMPATRKALAKAGLTVDQIDLFEVNEAFAAVVMRFMKEMKVPHDKVNVNGGAIAMGHPLGATGAMILGTLVDELHRRKLRYGLATLCVGGGMGIATIVERV
jgi:acetyl-CoA C-acetyltransferase